MFLSHWKAAVDIFFSKHDLIWECYFKIVIYIEVALSNHNMFAEEYIYSSFPMTKKHGKMFTKQFRVSNGMNLKLSNHDMFAEEYI